MATFTRSVCPWLSLLWRMLSRMLFVRACCTPLASQLTRPLGGGGGRWFTDRGLGDRVAIPRREGVARSVVPVDTMFDGSLERGEMFEVPVVGVGEVRVRSGAG